MSETRSPTMIASVRRGLRLMQAVASHPAGAPAKQLARQADLPLATAYHLLRTLVHEGYVVRTADGVYLLGDQVDSLQAGRRTQVLLGQVRAALADLRDDLCAAAYLCVYEDGEIRIIDVADGPRAPRVDLWVGLNDAAHATAVGKCVLAQLGADERRDHLARHPMVDLTPNTITRVGELERRLDAPVAIDVEEYILGTGCAAVPVTDAAGTTIAALAVSCSPERLPRIQASVARIQATAVRITRAFTI